MPRSSIGPIIVALFAFSLPSSLALSKPDGTKSNIIEAAGETDLYYGVGDVPADGPCKGDIKAFCKDVTEGESRVANCLSKRIRASKLANVAGTKVNQKCIDEMVAFRIDRSDNINKDVPLAKACVEDAAKLCPEVSDLSSPGSTLQCLKEKKQKVVSKRCKSEIFRTEIEAVEDFRSDYKLRTACTDDISNLCMDVEPGQSREIECLTSKRMQVSWECQDQMFRSEQVAEDDIRLHVRLFNKCFGDYQRYCKDVEPGAMRVQECLEDNIEEADFTEDCKEELDNTIAKRVADFRLDEALRNACEVDLGDLCGISLEAMDEDNNVRDRGLQCLQQIREEIKSDACKSEVHRRMERASRDVRFDDVLASACAEDRAQFCNDVSPGSARVIRCLQDHRTTLQGTCAAALFDHEVSMAEDIDFKYPLKKACAWEISSLCKDIPHGHTRVVRCLEENLDNDDMSPDCKTEVMKDMNRMAKDFRLNYRLTSTCAEDVSRMCQNPCSTSPGQTCGGLVLQCLTEQQANISSEACQEEVFYYQLMEVTDFRNDVMLAEACRDDVAAYCKDVQPGEGRVHTCLRFNKDRIGPRCLKEENKLATIEYQDIRLRPKLQKLCSEEKAVYCKETKPGKARVVKCLIENMAEPNFGEDCKVEIEKREDQMKSDYRYDVGVANNCAADIEMYCAEEKTKLRGTASVLKCLATNFASLTDSCQAEMSRAVRLALWDYKPGAALTQMCDQDVETMCPSSQGGASKSGSMFSIGVVGRCLSVALVRGQRMDSKCRGMVLVAAPKDARSYFENAESANAIMAKIADLQAAAGMEGALVDSSGSTVTVTGWVALACIISLFVVIIGGAFMLYRQAAGVDKPHTMHVKMGDA